MGVWSGGAVDLEAAYKLAKLGSGCQHQPVAPQEQLPRELSGRGLTETMKTLGVLKGTEADEIHLAEGKGSS
jgi:hypothetical protein